MTLTDDRNHPGVNKPRGDGQNVAYLVLSEEERAKGFVRAVRESYRHVGPPAICGKPHAGSDGTELECVDEPGHEGECTIWQRKGTHEARVAKACKEITRMARPLAETYARQPDFYGATFCVGCKTHIVVGARGEFVWVEPDGSDGARVGT